MKEIAHKDNNMVARKGLELAKRFRYIVGKAVIKLFRAREFVVTGFTRLTTHDHGISQVLAGVMQN